MGLKMTVKELINLEGRTGLVTGGGGRIGSAICETLAELGASVAVVDIDEKAADDVAATVHETYDIETSAMIVNLSDEKSVAALPDRVVDRFGRLDILVNCAALVGTSELKGWATSFEEQSPAVWGPALQTNLTAPFILTQACAKELTKSKCGSVINIGSIYGIVGPDMRLYEGTPMGNPAAYAASKGGLLQLTRWLATVLAPDVRVNAVSPGGVWREQPEEFRSRYAARTPLGRMATENDLKGAVAYLAGDLSAYVTGQNLVVDGGWTAW